MIDKYPVITLCGSTRFKHQFLEAQKRLTLEGNIVISVGLFGHSSDNDFCTSVRRSNIAVTTTPIFPASTPWVFPSPSVLPFIILR